MITPGRTFVACAALLVMFAALSWTAALTKNATVDEPGHALSGWLMWRYSDFRLAPENPSLWQLWAALPNVCRPLTVHFDAKVFSDRSFDSQGGINWVRRTLYQTPGNDGESLVRHSRTMLLLLGVLLGAGIGYFSFRLSGPVAALIAVGLFCLDPNFLAHASVVKSDVALALVMLALTYTVWQLGIRASTGRALMVAALCGIAMNTKFSGLSLLPIVWALLLIRAMRSTPWSLHNTAGQSRAARLCMAAGICLVTVCMSTAVTWASYGFRFRPAVSPASQMDMPAIRAAAIKLECGSTLNPVRVPTPAEIAAWKPSLIVRSIDVANTHRLMPQAWLAGLLYQHACMQAWPSFLMGRRYETGAWYYFPLALLFKTPSATLLGIALSLFLILCYFKRWARSISDSKDGQWSVICILLPLTIFTAAALQSHLDIGLRSILPLYPFLFIGVGVILSQLVVLRPRLSRMLLTGLAGALLAETLFAWPNFIPFFNAPAGGQRGGFALLGDSNLDWGQDLKPLSTWHQQHPDVPILLHYFGVPDPAFFSPDFHTFEVTDDGRLTCDTPVHGGVLAISANYLQGLYDTPADAGFFQRLGQHPPDEVVGGSIYLYRDHGR